MPVPNLFGGSDAGSSGVPNLFGSPAAAPAGGLDALLRQLQAQGGGESSHTPWGFLGNLVGGVKDLGLGITGLVGSAAHDIGMLVPQALGGDPSYKLDDIAKSLAGIDQPGHPGFHPTESVIAEDLGERYGMLAPGGRPASQIMQSVYDKPLAFGLDAATVAAAAAKGAQLSGIAKLGGKTALEGEAALAGTGPASEAARAIDMLKNTPGIGARRSLSAGVRTGLESALGEGEALSPLYRLLPKQTYRTLESGQGANMFLPGTEALNPFNRLFTNPMRRALTEPRSKLETKVSALAGEMSADAAKSITPFGRTYGTVKMYEDLLQGATERELTRIDRPFLRRTNYVTALGRRIVMDTTADAIKYRNELIKPYVELLNKYIDKDVAEGKTDMHDYVIEANAQHVGLEGASPAEWAQARYADIEGPTISLHGRDPMIDTSIPNEVRTALEGDPILAQLEPVYDDLTELKARFGPHDLSEADGWTPEHALAIEELQREMANTLKRRVEAMRSPGTIKNSTMALDEVRAQDFVGRAELLLKDPSEALRMFNRKYAPFMEKYKASVGDEPLGPPSAAAQPAVVAEATGEAVDYSIRARNSGELAASLPDDHPAVVAATDEMVSNKIKAAGSPGTPDFIAEAKQRAMSRLIKDAKAEGLWSKPDDLWDGNAPSALQREIVTGEKAAPGVPTPAEISPATERVLDPFEVADAFNAAGIPEPSYFPFVQRQPNASDFFTAKAKVGAVRLAKDPNEKQFMGILLRDGDYVTDPVKAYSQRAARRARAESTLATYDQLYRTMGREITPEEYKMFGRDAVPEGWIAASPDAMYLKRRSHLRFQEKVEELRAEGADVDTAVSTAMDEIGNATIRDLDTIFSGAKPPKVYAIPKALDDQIGAASKWAKAANPNWVKAGYDPMMNVWRSLVLTGSPRWVVNNVLGNTVFGAMQGVKTADVMRILTERLRLMWAKWAKAHGWDDTSEFLGGTELREGTLAQAVHELPGHEGVGSGWFSKDNLESYVTHLGPDAEQTKMGRFVTNVRTPGTTMNKYMRTPHRISTSVRTFNQEIEGAFRDASFLSAIEKQQGISAVSRTLRSFDNSQKRMKQIMDGGYTERSAAAAIDEVNHFYGDYTGLSPFERHVVRRWVMPFYAFYKHTVKLMLSFPFQYPGRAQVLMALSNVTKDMMQQYGPIPGWLESAIPLGPPGSEVSFLRTAGANPFQGMFQDPTQMLAPPIKIFLEQALGKDMFTGENFTDANTFAPFGSDLSIDMNTLQPREAPRPGILEHIASQIPQYDMIKRALAGGVTYDTADILDVVRGQGTILDTDPESETYGQPKYPQGVLEQLAKLSGFNASPYDLGAYQESLSDAQKQALAEVIKQMTAQEMTA